MKFTTSQTVSATLSSFVVVVQAIQIPYNVGSQSPVRYGDTPSNKLGLRYESWNLTEDISVNSTSNFVFETVNSLLQHWPNTRYRNGHSLVPASIPRGTLLYHGTYKPEIPTIPEWLAVDPEHSSQFCGGPIFRPPPGRLPKPPPPPGDGSTMDDGSCWHLTLVTDRPLKLLYFDGSSAAKMPGGSLDSQDLITWGKVPKKGGVQNERERINKLCEWGKKYELDGFVRMEMDFEVMFCDFTKGLKPVSILNLRDIRGKNRKGPKLPGFFGSTRVIQSGSWANRFPGELRIQLDYSRIISFYDKDLFPSLHTDRKGQERWDHRLQAISKEDKETLFARLDGVLSANSTAAGGSGIDWKTLLHVVTDRYAERLELLSYILNSTSDTSVELLHKAHRYVSDMLMTYTLHDVVPPKDQTGTGNHDWATPVFKQCSTTHTKYLFEIEASRPNSLTYSERFLLTAVHDVSKEICRVLVNIWAEGEESWGTVVKGNDQRSVDQTQMDVSFDDMKARWSSSVSNLMSWLDWSIWVRCRPECGYEEMCYLPTWPYFFFPREQRSVLEEEWRRPQPKCIRRIEPYDL